MTPFFAPTDDRPATCAHCGAGCWLPPESDRSEASRRLGAWCSSECARALAAPTILEAMQAAVDNAYAARALTEDQFLCACVELDRASGDADPEFDSARSVLRAQAKIGALAALLQLLTLPILSGTQRAANRVADARLRAISLAQAAARIESGVDEGPDFSAWELAS